MSKLKYFLLAGFMMVSCVKASEEAKDASKEAVATKEIVALKEEDTTKKTDTYKEIDRFKDVDASVVQTIYQTLLDMHDFFTLFDIKYFITEETLLGAVRHKGLIPWEENLSLCMFQSDQEKFLKLVPVLRSMGYEVVGMYYGFKIYSTKAASIEGYPWKFPGCDIFMMNTDGQKMFNMWRLRKEKNRNIEIDLSDILPLRKYTFGTLIVYGPRNPAPILKESYGEQYLTLASKWYDHANEKGLKKGYKQIFKTLEDEDFRHLSPQEPLVHSLVSTSLIYWPLDFVDTYPHASW